MGAILKIKSKSITTLFCLVLLASANAFGKDFGVVEKTFPVVEKNPVEVIKSRLSKMEKSGELKQVQDQWKNNAVKSAKRPKDALKTINKATSNNVRYYDPSITVQNDLKDHQGKVFAKKGTKVNPFNHFPNYFPQLIFIDGDDEAQVKFAIETAQDKNFSTKIILVRGSAIELIKLNKRPIFFDQGGGLCEKFGLEAFPSIVKREGEMLKIEEVAL